MIFLAGKGFRLTLREPLQIGDRLVLRFILVCILLLPSML